MKILVVEDDRATADLECDYLKINGFEYELARDGRAGLEMALRNEYALIILDVTLPNKDGFEICREIRNSKDVPIIFVSGRCDDIDVVRGLGLGADDYVKKPFSINELMARIKAHISRYERLVAKRPEKKSDILTIKGLKINKSSRRVFVDGVEKIMPVKEYDLLLFLAENPNIVFSKERLFDRIWGIDAIGDSSTVTVHIQRIREKINKNRSGIKYIETVWGAGYRF